jgi:eukaryotic-like serine/threonine-protein kinase
LLLIAILEGDAPSASGVAPPALDRVLQRCLVKDPEERWQPARDISHAIAAVYDSPAAQKKHVTKRWTLAVASLVGFLTASALGGALWTTWPRPQAERRPLSFHLTPPPGAEFQFSLIGGASVISPDGQSVAFVAVTNGTPRLWIRPLSSLTARELQDTEGAKQPFWSPDSRAIGFFTSSATVTATTVTAWFCQIAWQRDQRPAVVSGGASPTRKPCQS